MLEMFKGVANSPETTITNNISNSDTLIYVLDETRIPEPPNLMVLGTGVGAETIKVLSIDGNAITVERGFQGVAKAWNAGTIIARNFTEYDYNALVENVRTLKENTDTNAGDILDLMQYVGDLESLDTIEKSNIVLALNEIYQDLVAHKAENASKHITESGSHANGRYIKFDDGTMICRRVENVGIINDYPTKAVLPDLVYPAAFIEPPATSVTYSILTSSADLGSAFLVTTSGVSLTAWSRNRIRNVGNVTGTQPITIELVAIGRWKV